MKRFFFNDGKFKPVYFWITTFCFLAAITWGFKIFGSEWISARISDTLLISIMGFIATWVGLYNWDRKNKRPQYVRFTEGEE